MRLICPNCSAQYEVDAELIPAEGREVQCSECSTLWFQHPASSSDAPRAGADDAGLSPDAADEPDDPDDGLLPPPGPLPRRAAPSGMRDEVRSILMEEAARESRARRGLPIPDETEGSLPDEDGLTWPPAPATRIRRPVQPAQEAAERSADFATQGPAERGVGLSRDERAYEDPARQTQTWPSPERGELRNADRPGAGAADTLWPEDHGQDAAQDARKSERAAAPAQSNAPDDGFWPEDDWPEDDWPGADWNADDGQDDDRQNDAGQDTSRRGEPAAGVGSPVAAQAAAAPRAERAPTEQTESDWPEAAPSGWADTGRPAAGRPDTGWADADLARSDWPAPEPAAPADDLPRSWPEHAFPAGADKTTAPPGRNPAPPAPGDLLAEAMAVSGPVPDNKTWAETTGAADPGSPGLSALASARQAGAAPSPRLQAADRITPDSAYDLPAPAGAGPASAAAGAFSRSASAGTGATNPPAGAESRFAPDGAAARPAYGAAATGVRDTVTPAQPAPAQTVSAPAAKSRSGETMPTRSRRDLLPDIEEINSALDPAHDETLAEPAGDEPRRSSGFSSGFLSVIVLAVLAALVYALAGPLSRSVPALAPALDAYTQHVDSLRIWLDETVRGWITTSR